jgi:hypothetical protein
MMPKEPIVVLLSDLWLCPGDDDVPAHVTNSAVCCPACGNSNLASLSRIMDRETPLESWLEAPLRSELDLCFQVVERADA